MTAVGNSNPASQLAVVGVRQKKDACSPRGCADENEMGEEVGPLDGRNAADHAGHGVPHVHGAAQLHLVHERHQVVGEPRERVAAAVLPVGVGSVGGGAREVPVEE